MGGRCHGRRRESRALITKKRWDSGIGVTKSSPTEAVDRRFVGAAEREGFEPSSFDPTGPTGIGEMHRVEKGPRSKSQIPGRRTAKLPACGDLRSARQADQ